MLILLLIGALMFAYNTQTLMATDNSIITSDLILIDLQYPVIGNVILCLPNVNFDDAPVIIWTSNNLTITNKTTWVRIPNFDDFLNFTGINWEGLLNITLHGAPSGGTVEGKIEAKDNSSDVPATFIPVNITEPNVVNCESVTVQDTLENSDPKSQAEIVAEFPSVSTSLVFMLTILTVMATLAKIKKQKL